MANIRQLRSVINETLIDSRPPSQKLFNETVAWLTDGEPLNEAYYGRKSVEPILKAMQKIRIKYLTNPKINMTEAPENKELEKAIKKVFGFKSVYVYWVNSFDLMKGPFTVPGAIIINSDGPYIKIGENRNGYYDTEHRLKVGISSDLVLFDEPTSLTAEEMTAMFLHEIGHNFDYTVYGIIDDFSLIIQNIIEAVNLLSQGDVSGALGMALGTGIVSVLHDQPKLLIWFFNIQDILINAIPPIGQIVREVGTEVRPLLRMLDLIRGPFRWINSTMLTIMRMPIRLFSRFLLRKKETYADSFAAAYGYGAEITSGLEKLDYFIIVPTSDPGPFMNVLIDLEMLRTEVSQTCGMGHGSTQQRTLRMIDSLNTDLNKGNLTKEQRREIEKERDRLVAMYEKFVDMPDDKRLLVTKIYRTFIDNWYAGKPYALFPPVYKQYAD